MATYSDISLFYQKQMEAGERVVQEPVKFDLEQYISNYKDATKLDRLLVIGRTSTLLGQDALQGAMQEAKRRKHVKGYRTAAEMLSQMSGKTQLSKADSSWIATAEHAVKVETKRLEDLLKGYRNNMIKESIRLTNEELGDHYRKTGRLTFALNAYSGMREYCTGPFQNYNLSLKLILTAIEQKQWMSVTAQLSKLQTGVATLPGDLRLVAPSIAQACYGLSQMMNRNYRAAADHFMSVDMVIGEHLDEVMTINDIAVYGGLCALASRDRRSLQTDVLEKARFRPFLELEPHVRQTITFFCGAKYGACLDLLNSYRPDYLLDYFMRDHIEDIINIVKKESIIQYFTPFSCVSIRAMAKAFSTEESVMVTELINMISNGRLDARIDTQKGLLLARERNERAEMQQQALQMIDGYQRAMRIRLMRMNIAWAGLELKGLKESGRGPQRGPSITDYTI